MEGENKGVSLIDRGWVRLLKVFINKKPTSLLPPLPSPTAFLLLRVSTIQQEKQWWWFSCSSAVLLRLTMK